MPGLRDNARKTLEANIIQETSEMPQVTEVIETEKAKKRSSCNKSKDWHVVPDSREGYSHRSSVLKAYEAGEMPVDHRKLLNGIKRALGNKQEGEINLGKVLEEVGFFRASALKMLKHMQNFGVLETESRYQATWVKILDNYVLKN